jgi:hypothetical protein
MELSREQALWAPLAKSILANILAYSDSEVSDAFNTHIYNRVLEGLWKCAEQTRKLPQPAVDGEIDLRPDFEGFVRACRDEASWADRIKAPPDKKATGQTTTDVRELMNLADRAERLGIRQGYLSEKVTQEP